MKRFRCTRCDRIVQERELAPHPISKYAASLGSPVANLRYHKRWQKRFSSGAELLDCGPVEEEEVPEFVAQFEAFIGETI